MHSVFARACNIETQTGELVTLLGAGLGNIPHGIRLAGPVAPFESWVTPGQSAILENSTICVANARITVYLSGAVVWRGTVAAVSMESCSKALSTALHDLRAMLSNHAPGAGFGPWCGSRVGARSPIDRAFANRVLHALPPLARATARRDAAGVAAAATQLVGLGPGLTPSGDDFLVGFLAALRSRASFDRGIGAMLRALEDFLPPLLVRTNAISRQMLGDAAQGFFAERLVEVTAVIAAGGEVGEAAARALSCGHSSGADTLCGLLFGYAPDLAAPSSPWHTTARAPALRRYTGRAAASA
jgi:hypothetical protein